MLVELFLINFVMINHFCEYFGVIISPNRNSKIDNKYNPMRYSTVTNGRKRGIGHNKSGKVFRRENNGIEEGIKRNLIICYGRRSLSERSLTNGIRN